ncbi:FAD-dependent oxidoreductase [Alteromonas lipolytica]|uniref:FAD-dependent oxidoreductase n=1 Tax=Alteromonas lipolytica TaxID=1856405 RepID=UPI0009F4D7DA|nr:FAD-dependent oxidoreductase [Alteromonas lipolytica]GGF72864.1 fumarate reductase [Alteromonas lipolytica]
MPDIKATVTGHISKDVPEFLQKPAPITDITETKEFDIVVIGAGTPGVPCALAAREEGATVAILQKEDDASACGNVGSGINLANSDAADIEALLSHLMADSGHRPKRGLLTSWAQNSGEAINWLIEKMQAAGAQVSDLGNGAHAGLLEKNGFNISFVTSFFGPKPYDVGDALKSLCRLAEKEGVETFFRTPAKQLVVDNGRVVGVIAETENGYVQFKAKKGVVVATGDYQNDRDMMGYYLPDVGNLVPKKAGRTGDGHKMIVWAGGRIENLGHTKMCHDFDSGPMCNQPFMRVKLNGKRFCDETLGMELMNNYVLDAENKGHYCQIFDADYMEKAADWSGELVAPEELKMWMPEEDVERKGVEVDLINTVKADTLEELAAKLGITDVDAFISSVQRYNEMVAEGQDTEFGKPSKFLKTIDKAPYYGIHRLLGMSMSCSGVEVDENLQCLDINGNPIDGLYAAGNCAGNFYGGVEYPMTVAGLNLGHNYTQGYVIGKALAKR